MKRFFRLVSPIGIRRPIQGWKNSMEAGAPRASIKKRSPPPLSSRPPPAFSRKGVKENGGEGTSKALFPIHRFPLDRPSF